MLRRKKYAAIHLSIIGGTAVVAWHKRRKSADREKGMRRKEGRGSERKRGIKIAIEMGIDIVVEVEERFQDVVEQQTLFRTLVDLMFLQTQTSTLSPEPTCIAPGHGLNGVYQLVAEYGVTDFPWINVFPCPSSGRDSEEGVYERSIEYKINSDRVRHSLILKAENVIHSRPYTPWDGNGGTGLRGILTNYCGHFKDRVTRLLEVKSSDDQKIIETLSWQTLIRSRHTRDRDGLMVMSLEEADPATGPIWTKPISLRDPNTCFPSTTPGALNRYKIQPFAAGATYRDEYIAEPSDTAKAKLDKYYGCVQYMNWIVKMRAYCIKYNIRPADIRIILFFG